MKKNYCFRGRLMKSYLPGILALLFFSLSGCATPTAHPPQVDAKPVYTPPPDQLIYFKCGKKERSVSVRATSENVPGVSHNLKYLKYTDVSLGAGGYRLIDNPSRAAIKVRVIAKYNQVDNSQAVANEVGSKVATGAVVGILNALAGGGGGNDAAQGAAGGAADALASGSTTPPLLKYLTLEFEISSKAGGTETGRTTKDITNCNMTIEEFIDGAIGDYLEAALPQR